MQVTQEYTVDPVMAIWEGKLVFISQVEVQG